MKIIAIVAASRNNVIGADNKMPWHLPDDFRHFKSHTMGHTILMGKNTWRSIGRALPGRANWVVSGSLDPVEENVRVFPSVEVAINEAQQMNTDKLFIIGGGQLYKSMLHLFDTIIMTRVHEEFEKGDTFFPEINPGTWTLTSAVFHPKDEKHQYDFTFETWERTQPVSGD